MWSGCTLPCLTLPYVTLRCVMLGLHYVPGSHFLSLCSSSVKSRYVFSRSVKVCRDSGSPACYDLSRMVLRSIPACHVLLGPLTFCYVAIIPTQCFYRFFGDFDWSVCKIKLFLHFDKNPCVGIFDNCLDFTVLDCVDNNELYRKLNYFYQIKYS